jgi:hypothetical protein
MPSGIPDFHRLGDPEAEVLLDAQAMRALMPCARMGGYGALVLHRLKVLSSIAAQTRRSSAEHQPGRGNTMDLARTADNALIASIIEDIARSADDS